MSKRFTDTNKYKKPFIRGLQGAYKLLWDYLYHDCDHAGIWIVDFQIAQIYIGDDMPINKNDALKYFNDGEIRIIEIDNNTKWFIPSFISFQYGILSEENRAHNSVIQILKKYELWNKGLITPLQGRKDKDKDMDKDKDKDMDKEKTWKTSFEIYSKELTEFYNQLISDQDYIKDRQKYHPNMDIELSLEKAYKDYWNTEAGWKRKKQARIKEIDWKATFTNALTLKSNQVWNRNSGGLPSSNLK